MRYTCTTIKIFNPLSQFSRPGTPSVLFISCLHVYSVWVWCVGSGFPFFSSSTTTLASVLYTCICTYYASLLGTSMYAHNSYISRYSAVNEIQGNSRAVPYTTCVTTISIPHLLVIRQYTVFMDSTWCQLYSRTLS